MSKSFKIALGIIFIPLIVGFIVKSFFLDSIDYFRVAKTIPEYPTAINYQVSGQSSLPMYNTRYGWITFKTNDSVEKVMEFYKKTLPNEGWKFKDTSSDTTFSDYISYNSKFTKQIVLKEYKLNLSQAKALSPFQKDREMQVYISIF